MDALIIKKSYLDAILSGQKTWELRGGVTHKRGKIALIESKSGTVVGTAILMGCIQLSQDTFLKHQPLHQSKQTALPYLHTYAWQFTNATRLSTPVPYHHPNGAIIWVKLPFEL